MRSAWVALLAIGLLVSGCLQQASKEGDGSTAGSSPATDGSSPTPTGAQTPQATGTQAQPTGHGTPQRTNSDVTVSNQGNNEYKASQTVTITNDFGGATTAALNLTTLNGGITATAWKQAGYRFVVNLEASGSTEQQARDALAGMDVIGTDKLDGSSLALGVEVGLNANSLPVSVGGVPVVGSSNHGATISADLPSPPSYRAALATSNGGIGVSGLHGDRVAATTSNAGVAVSGDWDAASLATSNAGISATGAINDLTGTTSNAGIVAKVSATRNGQQTLSTSNAGIVWSLKGSDHTGVDVDAGTSNGAVTSHLPGLSCSGKTCSGKTAGYATMPRQLKLSAHSSNSDIDLGTA